MKPLKLLVSIALLFTIFLAPALGYSQTKTKGKSSSGEASKKVGFSGDPARKRGMEIGFDLGKKAGKSDKEQDLKPDLKRHENYQKPEKYFRSEYGSQASFSSGFRSGFSGGYQAAFGKKVKFTSDGVPLKSGKTVPLPKKSAGSASDAL